MRLPDPKHSWKLLLKEDMGARWQRTPPTDPGYRRSLQAPTAAPFFTECAVLWAKEASLT